MRFDDVVDLIRCPGCGGTGSLTDGSACRVCNESGINPEVIEEAGGWDSWAMTVHDSPGWYVSVNLGLSDPTGNASVSDPWSSEMVDKPTA